MKTDPPQLSRELDQMYLIGRGQKQVHSWFERTSSASQETQLAIARGYYSDSAHITLKLVRRRVLLPVAWTAYYPVVTEAIVDILTAHQISGWKVYPVVIEEGVPGLEPRFALGITGRCAQIEFGEDPENFVMRMEHGRLGLHAKLLVNLTGWDGSDFYMARGEESLHRCATAAVVRAFSIIKKPGIVFERASDSTLWMRRAPSD